MDVLAERLLGPRGWVPRTPWPALGAVAAGVALFLLAHIAAAALVVAFTRGAARAGGSDVQIVAIAQLILIGGVLVLAEFRGGDPRLVLHLDPAPGRAGHVETWIRLLVLCGGYSLFVYAVAPDVMAADLRQFRALAANNLPFAIFVVLIGAPVAEELLFRGFLLPALARRLGFIPAMVATTGLWTAMHAYSIYGLIEVFLIGTILSTALWRWGSLRVCILGHALYNATFLALMFAGILPE